MSIFLVTVGIIFILYCICIMFFISHTSYFYLIWGILGAVLIIWGKFYPWYVWHIPNIIKRIIFVGISAMLLLFVIVEGMIISDFVKSAPKQLDYIIVLGAQLKENGPSYSLQMRLDRAYEYLSENPRTMVIVSGGQGSNEPDTEAQGMYDYLVKRGISSDRIIKEDRSVNTHQNLSYSSHFLNKGVDSVGVVTNNFHVFRALGIARTAGYEHVYGIASGAYVPLLPTNMLREFFGIIKDFLEGNLG